MKKCLDLFNNICSAESLFSAWDEFKIGKTKKLDVLQFEKNLEQNIFKLHRELRNGIYKHGPYEGFFITDPKLRHIHKATVRDRVLHHSLFRALNLMFEPSFISSSFSCRVGKGTHKGVEAVSKMLRKASLNNRETCFALKCDIRKFFDSVDHQILFEILKRKIKNKETLPLLKEIIGSYTQDVHGTHERERERESTFALRAKGIPIGNLTSQLFANVYMNEFDQFVKHTLKIKSYARYTDDFLIISRDLQYLAGLVYPIQIFLESKLRLQLHPDKIQINKYSQGIDFLGYVIFPHHRLLRKRTEKRMIRKLRAKASAYENGKLQKENVTQSLQSYLGILSHANTYYLRQDLQNTYGFLRNPKK